MGSFKGLRIISAALIVLVLLVLMPPALQAKGPSVETEEAGYRPGKRAVARAVFGPGSYDGKVSDGPFYAYLIPYNKLLVPGPLPEFARPLGEITIVPIGSAVWRATLKFRVPHIAPGLYRLDYCDIPCTVEGVGELESGSFQILETRQEARLDRLQAAIRRLRQQAREIALRSSRTEGDNEVEIAPPSRFSALYALGLVAVGLLGFAALLLAAHDRRRLRRMSRPIGPHGNDASLGISHRAPVRP